MHVVLIVLGDVGRSPRMQYHALSLLKTGHRVTLVGYHGEDVIPQLKAFPDRLRLVRFDVWNLPLLNRIRPLYFLWRIVSLALVLTWQLLARVPLSVDSIIVQNPPALPLLAVAYLYSRMLAIIGRYRPGLIIDWHNLGYSMLGEGALARLARAYETALAPSADAHWTVTQAMQTFLQSQMALQNITVVVDSPPELFQPLPIEQQHDILQKLHGQLCHGLPLSWQVDESSTETLLTVQSANGQIHPRRHRPALVTSSTSWTPDEDFGILLAALRQLDQRLQGSDLRVLVVVTGKGPQKQDYVEQISKLSMEHVAIQTLWLEPCDYPHLLACADLGVSLHTSTSGLDLPMKILDLFGCGVPVAAMNFACLSELVDDGVNGRVFDSSEQLTEQLLELLSPLTSATEAPPHSFGRLKEYAKALENYPRWDANWKAHAAPVIQRVARVHRK